jgi:hypothetical protein
VIGSIDQTIKIIYKITAKTTPFAIFMRINDEIYKESIILPLKDTTWSFAGYGTE